MRPRSDLDGGLADRLRPSHSARVISYSTSPCSVPGSGSGEVSHHLGVAIEIDEKVHVIDRD